MGKDWENLKVLQLAFGEVHDNLVDITSSRPHERKSTSSGGGTLQKDSICIYTFYIFNNMFLQTRWHIQEHAGTP